VAARVIARVCIAVFVCGIAGLIVASVAGNNNGVVLSIGAAIALAAIVLMTVNTVTVTDASDRIDAFIEAHDEAEEAERLAERLEAQINRLVDQGADERDVRDLIRDAWRVRRP
jgi:hypothetical protein